MWRRAFVLMPLFLGVVCSSAPKARFTKEDEGAIESLILAKADIARRAWRAGDARIMIPETTTVSVRTPFGEVLSPETMRAELQRRMDRVVRIDTMGVHVDSFRVAGRDSVYAYSTQRFVRLIRRPEDGREGQRFSVAVHEQLFVRRGGRWVDAGPEREMDTWNWWAGDEPPPGQ